MTNAIGPVGTTALTVVALIWRRDGTVASTGNAWVAFSTGLSWSSYVRSTTEFGATGSYNLAIHADLQKDWWFVSFHDGTTPGATLASLTEAIAICENPTPQEKIVEDETSYTDVLKLLNAFLSGDIVPNGANSWTIKSPSGSKDRIVFTTTPSTQSRNVSSTDVS